MNRCLCLCRRLFCLPVLVLLLLVLGGSPVSPSSPPGPRTLRVALDNNYPPYIFLDNTGQMQGILVDLWHLWQQRTGIRVELVPLDWGKAVSGMREGQFDVLDTAFQTEERLRWLEFGQPYARIEVAAFFHKDISAVTDGQSLRGFAVAIKEGDAAAEMLHGLGVENLVLFKSYEAIVEAARARKVNVFVADKPPSLYFLFKYDVQNQFKASPPLAIGEFHRAVAKGQTALLREVEEGFARISRSEYEKIEQHWYGAPVLGNVSVVQVAVAVAVFLLLLLALLLWNRTLHGAVRRRTVELERSQQALQASEARFRELVENANSIILRRDGQGTIRYLNDFGQRFFGYALEEVVGRNVLGTIVPEFDSLGRNLAAMIRDITANPDQYATNENENMRRDGSRVWIAWTNKSLYDATGVLREILCVGNDITRRRQAEQALHQERERLEFIIEGSRLGTWEWSIPNNAFTGNATCAAILGYTGAEFGPMTFEAWLQLLHPEDQGPVMDMMSRCVMDPASDFDSEFRMRHQAGHWVWILGRGRILTRDPEGKSLSMFGTNTDISRIKKAEEERQASNEMFAQFLRHSPIYAFIKEVDQATSRYLMVSDNFGEMLQRPLAQIIGKSMTEVLPVEIAARVSADDWRVLSDNTVLQLEESFNDRYYSTIKFPLHLGERLLLAGYTIDLTGRRQAESALRESEATFRNIVQASPMGIHLYEHQADGRLIFVGANPAADRLLGVDHGQFIGQTIETVFPGLAGTDIPDRYRRVAQDGENFMVPHFEYHHGTIAGFFEFYSFQMSPGKVAVLFNDISTRRRAEEEQGRLQAQLTQARKMESIGRLAGGVAHDFNNMLGVILGHCEMALHGLNVDHPLFAGLHNIRQAAERSAELTRQLLAFARKQTVAPKVLDLNHTLVGLMDMLRRLIGEDIVLRWQPGEVSGKVRIDPSQVDQVLVNLTVNARDAIGDTGQVTIETAQVALGPEECAGYTDAQPGDYVVLTVRDDGCGMDGEVLSHLFEPFYTTKALGRGTGLGLATVYGIVKQNGGFIHVVSDTGRGSSIQVFLPCFGPGSAEVRKQAEGGPPALPGTETILLVEDETMILKIASSMLTTLGYKVLAVSTPREAIRLAGAQRGAINLLLTDVVMPEMNGRMLANQLLAQYPGLKCLFMSGYTADVIAHHGVLDEGVHFIQKPFTMVSLASKVREVLDSGAAS